MLNGIPLTEGMWMALITFVGGFVLSYMTQYLPSRRKQKSDDFKIILEHYQSQYASIIEEVNSLRLKESDCMERYSELESQLLKLQSTMILMKASSPNIPIPMWIKDTNGTMLALNDEYEKSFLMPLGKRREDSIGKTEDSIWGEELAKKFRKSDLKAMETDSIVLVSNPIKIGDDNNSWLILKYPNKIGDLVITIGGIAFPEPKDRKIIKNRYEKG